MKIKTSELQGAALDWAVAKCEETRTGVWATARPPSYSSDWSLAGRIIEREGIDLCKQYAIGSDRDWVARLEWLDEPHGEGFGTTPLIAAMRCYVASRLGAEIEIPEELK